MEASQNGIRSFKMQYKLNCFIKFAFLLQNETPIYNLAAGTCLNVKVAKIDAIITLDLCTESENNKWNLLKTVL